jgi:hypothetical protein
MKSDSSRMPSAPSSLSRMRSERISHMMGRRTRLGVWSQARRCHRIWLLEGDMAKS